MLVDAAQTAGVEDVNVQTMGIDLLAFTGHKGMLGPQGTGGLILGGSVDASEIAPIIRGGTGSASASEDQPEYLPDKFESGTPNGVGIAGLGAGVRWIVERGLSEIRARHESLMHRLLCGLMEIQGVIVYGPGPEERRAGLVSFLIEGHDTSEVGFALDQDYAILCRVGLHCAPAAHRTIGTFPQGAVRFGIGPFTTDSEIDRVLRAIGEIARR
jgi:selenocysteine lyase/cysteine desulfurase